MLQRLLSGKALIALFASLAALQIAAFTFYVSREAEWSPWVNGDAKWYLYFHYQMVDAMLGRSLIPRSIIESPQSFFFYLHTALLQVVAGVNRQTAVLTNLLHHLLFQGLLLSAIWHLTRSRSAVVLSLGLALSIGSPVSARTFALADFHPDLVMFFLAGSFYCAVILSDCFLRQRWAIVAAALAGLEVVLRLVSAAHVFLLYGTVIAVFLAVSRRASDETTRDVFRRRLLGALASLLVAVMISALPLILARDTLLRYYGGWLTSSLPREFMNLFTVSHSENIWDRLVYYPDVVARIHIGPVFAALSITVILLIIGAHARASAANPLPAPAQPKHGSLRCTLVLLVASAAIAYGLLTVYPPRSEHIARLFAMPLILLVIVTVCCSMANLRMPRFSAACASLSLATGVALQSWFYLAPIAYPDHDDARGIRELHDAISQYVRAEERATLKFSADFVGRLSVGYGANFSAVEFERSRRFVKVIGGLMQDGLAAHEQSAVTKLANSDVVLIDDGSRTRSGCLPEVEALASERFEASVQSFRPELRAFVSRNFVPAGEFEAFCRTMSLWVAVRPVAISASASPQPDRSLLSEFGPGWHARTTTRDHAVIDLSYLRPLTVGTVEVATLLDAFSDPPRSLRLSGSNDARSWKVLLDISSTELTRARPLATWSVPPHTPYLHFQLQVGGLGGDGYDLALGHLRLGITSYGSLARVAGSSQPPTENGAAALPVKRALEASDGLEPRLIGSVGAVNLVDFAGLYYGVPQSLGEFQWNSRRVASMPGVLLDISLDGLKGRVLDALVQETIGANSPQLLLSENRYNIVAFRGRVYGVPQALGDVSWNNTDVGELPGVVTGPSVGAVRAMLQGAK